VSNETLGLLAFKEEDTSVKLFPNPANDRVYFSDKTITNIVIFDINGKQLLSTASNSASVKTLPKGIYIIKAINTNRMSVTKKLVKN